MAGPTDRKALKAQVIHSLDLARASLGGEIAQVREQWHPRHLIQQSVEKHRLAVIISAAVAGFIATRMIFGSRQNSRDTSAKPARKRTLASFLLSNIWNLAREPLFGLAAQHLMPVALQYLSRFQSPPKQENFE
ncbi:hypothetical protein [Verrucomicrobium sp. BvORR034]|jgi:hypothetical protein|uniref:hypothetical protein n=1 Tax=Verrucomicrobium sp. BvORR034 TaxID=1396418 RepID=UPI0006791100|nr:hypothetical protein [Verrucomicrobium sp. BvORR034]